MTNEELEEVLENLKYMISDDCTDCQWDFIDEIELAIQALEKQMPKLAKYEVFNNVPHPTCAVCGCVLWKDYVYCPHCGQMAKREE